MYTYLAATGAVASQQQRHSHSALPATSRFIGRAVLNKGVRLS